MVDHQRPTALLVTSDEVLLDDLLRLVDAAGLAAVVAHEPAVATASWSDAAVVLVADDLAAGLARRSLPRRPGVVLVTTDADDEGVWRRGVQVGADLVVALPGDEPALGEALADAAGPGRGVVLTVTSGSGGAGGSSLAVAMALAAARRGCRAVLVDGDAWGGGLDVLLGLEDAPGRRWADLSDSRGRLGGERLLAALPSLASGRGAPGVAVVAFGRQGPDDVPEAAVRSVLGAAREGADLVVVDLPRGAGPVGSVAVPQARRALLVVRGEIASLAAGGRAADALAAGPVPELVVRGPLVSGVLPEDLADALAVPLLGVLRPEPGLTVARERGEPPGSRRRGPLARLATDLVDDVLVAHEPGRRRAG